MYQIYSPNVTTMGCMFSRCYRLASVDLSSFNTQNVTSMVLMFEYCALLTSLDLSSFNTHNVTDMSFMFQNCNSLKTLNLSTFNADKARTGFMLQGCKISRLDCSDQKIKGEIDECICF